VPSDQAVIDACRPAVATDRRGNPASAVRRTIV